MRILLNSLLCLLIGTISAVAQQTIVGNELTLQKSNFPILNKNISEYQLFQIDIKKSELEIKDANNLIDLELGERIYNLNLFNENLVFHSEAKDKPFLMAGSLRSGGIASITINEGFIFGFIKYGKTHVFIEPLHYIEPAAPKNIFVLYNVSDVIETDEHVCGVSKTRKHTDVPAKMTNSCKIVDLAIANTSDMFTKYGNATAVTNHNLAVLNNVQTNYRSEFDANLEYEVVAHYIPSTSGNNPLSPNTSTNNAVTLLTNFRNWARGPGNAGGGNSGGATGGFSIDYTMAQLWTDRDITFNGNSGTVGLAYTPGWHHLLEDYTASAPSLQVMVTHEMGHNWNASHDASGSDFIMAPSVTLTDAWSTASRTAINSRVSSQTYLDACSTVSAPLGNFLQSSIAACVGNNIEFEDQSQYGATRTWDFDNGTPSSSTDEKETVSFGSVGLHYVKITSTNGAGSNDYFGYVDIENEPTNSCFPSGSGGSDGITRLRIANVDNSSSASGAYQNFVCSQVASLDTSTSYTITFSVTHIGLSRFRLYCDWNNDGDFNDAGESLGNFNIPNQGTYNVNITTPASPVMETMLRFRAISNQTSINTPCFIPTNGQVEDYGVYFPVAQILGCTDPTANNYDPNATVDDGSCAYGGTTWYADTDADGFGDPNNTTTASSPPPGYVGDSTDCDDTDNTIYPNAPELCDGQINDCNTAFLPSNEVDDDGDGYVECTIDAGGWDGTSSVIGGDDCDDNDANNYPGNTEVCDGQDNDCDGMIDEDVTTTYYSDADGDGFGDPGNSTEACSQPGGFVTDNTDCDDSDNTIFPGATELCDGQINDCNTSTLPSDEVDDDGDNYVECVIDAGGWDGTASVIGGNDCDDNDANNYPSNTEVCDGQDNDCDGQIDEGILNTYYADNDGDSFGDNNNTTMACSLPSGYVTDNTDCDDNDANNYPGNTETCDGQDNDCDGQVDEGCGSGPTCDGDYLVINTITQNIYRAEFNINSDALLNNNQSIIYAAGVDIDLDPGFEVQVGTEFEARIEACSSTSAMNPTHENDGAFESLLLMEKLQNTIGEHKVNIEVLNRWGEDLIQLQGAWYDIEDTLRKKLLDLNEGIYTLNVKSDSLKLIQDIIILSE